MKLVISGIQPTGLVHLGNYLGTIKPFQNLQTSHSTLFLIADQHSISSSYFKALSGQSISQDLNSSIKNTILTLKACGIKNILPQSQVPEICQLSWLLGCISPISWYEKMIQFQAKKEALSGANLSILSYPALMAADILLFKSYQVLIGYDQREHLLLCQDLAMHFNTIFGEYFPIPQEILGHIYIAKNPCVMSLRDASKKMSKSSKNDSTRINIIDSPEIVRKKIMKAKTDCIMEVYYDEVNRMELANMIRIYYGIIGEEVNEVEVRKKWKDVLDFKNDLCHVAVLEVEKIREKYYEVVYKERFDKEVNGFVDEAKEIGRKNFEEIKKMVGFL